MSISALFAAISRGGKKIAADVNLVRHDLTDVQRAKAHARREALMVEMGLAKSKRGPIAAESAAIPYARQTADALGVSERTVRQDLARGKKIAPDVLAEIEGTRLDKGVVPTGSRPSAGMSSAPRSPRSRRCTRHRDSTRRSRPCGRRRTVR